MPTTTLLPSASHKRRSAVAACKGLPLTKIRAFPGARLLVHLARLAGPAATERPVAANDPLPRRAGPEAGSLSEFDFDYYVALRQRQRRQA